MIDWGLRLLADVLVEVVERMIVALGCMLYIC